MLTKSAADVDIARFVRALLDGTAAHPDFATLEFPEQRHILADVRRPWRMGGPDVPHVDRGVTVGRGEVRVRIFRPHGAATFSPALIYMHGGGFVYFGLDTHDRLMRELTARSGSKAAFPWSGLGPVDDLPAYDLVNLGIGLEKEKWSVTAYIDNLFDEVYWQGSQLSYSTRGAIVPYTPACSDFGCAPGSMGAAPPHGRFGLRPFVQVVGKRTERWSFDGLAKPAGLNSAGWSPFSPAAVRGSGSA
ncbi:alpha/beta hydrolase fold domain-containing protein [Sphingobium aquiterrae]|uniref:alpha/beta hydrolase fold domain-containing protein n=1 Tax=Sphingobium aquiterrae TaxID=2038656 RepID=UPI00301ACC99